MLYQCIAFLLILSTFRGLLMKRKSSAGEYHFPLAKSLDQPSRKRSCSTPRPEDSWSFSSWDKMFAFLRTAKQGLGKPIPWEPGGFKFLLSKHQINKWHCIKIFTHTLRSTNNEIFPAGSRNKPFARRIDIKIFIILSNCCGLGD